MLLVKVLRRHRLNLNEWRALTDAERNLCYAETLAHQQDVVKYRERLIERELLTPEAALLLWLIEGG